MSFPCSWPSVGTRPGKACSLGRPQWAAGGGGRASRPPLAFRHVREPPHRPAGSRPFGARRPHRGQGRGASRWSASATWASRSPWRSRRPGCAPSASTSTPHGSPRCRPGRSHVDDVPDAQLQAADQLRGHRRSRPAARGRRGLPLRAHAVRRDQDARSSTSCAARPATVGREPARGSARDPAVDHLPRHHHRGRAADPRGGERAARRRRLPPRLLPRARRPRQHHVDARQHAEGVRRRHARVRRGHARAAVQRSSTTRRW